MIAVSSASAQAATVAMPAHQVGDMIVVCVRRASNTPASIPAAGSGVPVYQTVQSAGANTLALTTVFAIATANNHQTGTFTNATEIIVFVLRPASGKTLAIGASSVGNGNNATSQIYPALTMQDLDGSSWGIRVGTRGAASAILKNVPTGWTNMYFVPATPSLVVHTRSGITSNPAADTVTGFTSSAYRSHTFEVKEETPTPPVNTTPPNLSGTEIAGNTLSCDTGSWSSPSGTPTYTYQWYRGITLISGATTNTYLLVTADIDQQINCRVTATNVAGSTEAVSSTQPTVIRGPDETLYDDFTRADGKVYAGAGATLWTVERLDWELATLMEVKGNALANPGTSYEQAVTKGRLGEGGVDFDLVVTCTATTATPGEIAIWFCVTGNGPIAAVDAYCLILSGTGNYWAVRKYIDGINSATLYGPETNPVFAPKIVAGDSIWISRRGNVYRIYHKPSGGNWSDYASFGDLSYSAGGVIAIETSDTTVRWDNVRGGPWTGLGPPPTAKVVSIA